MSKENRVFLFFLLLAAIAVRFLPLLRPIEALDGKIIPDDCYIALEIAKNIGQGRGPEYSGNFTNGYQPLFVLLAAPLYSLSTEEQLTDVEFLDRKAKQAIAIVAAADLVGLALLACTLAGYYGWSTPTLIAATIWALHPWVVQTSLNGLETSLATCLFFAIWYIFATKARASKKILPRILLGIALGLGVLARIDLFFAGAAIAAIELHDFLKGRWNRLEMTRGLLTTGLAFAAVYLPWVAWSWSYTGLFYPMSGSAVRYQSLAYCDPGAVPLILWPISLALGLATILVKAPILSLASVIILILGKLSLKRSADWKLALPLTTLKLYLQKSPLPWIVTGILLLAYTCYIFAWWFFPRYLFITILPLILTLSAASHVYVTQGPDGKKRRRLLLAVTILACVAQPRFWEPLIATPEPGFGYRGIGLWARERFEEGTVVGAMQTGGLAYYAPRIRIVNLDGVVNADALAALQEYELFEYMQRQGIEYFIDWRVNINFLHNHSEGGRGAPIIFLEEAAVQSWKQSWYLHKVPGKPPGPVELRR